MAPQAVSPYYYSKIRDLKNQNQLTTGKAFLSPEELAAITGAEIAQRYAANERSRDYNLREQAQKTQTDLAYENLNLAKDAAAANKKAAAISGVGQAITGAVGLYGLGKSLGLWGTTAAPTAAKTVAPVVMDSVAPALNIATPAVTNLVPSAIEGGYELGVGGGAALAGLEAGGAALGTEAATALTSAGGAFEAGMGLSSTGASMAGGGGAGAGAGGASAGALAAGFLPVAIVGGIGAYTSAQQEKARQYNLQSYNDNFNYIKSIRPNWSNFDIGAFLLSKGGTPESGIADLQEGIPENPVDLIAEWKKSGNIEGPIFDNLSNYMATRDPAYAAFEAKYRAPIDQLYMSDELKYGAGYAAYPEAYGGPPKGIDAPEYDYENLKAQIMADPYNNEDVKQIYLAKIDAKRTGTLINNIFGGGFV